MTFSVGQPRQRGSDFILEALGQGASRGLQESLSQYQKKKLADLRQAEEAVKRKERNLEKVGSTFNFYKKNFGYKDIPENDLQDIYKEARKMVNRGFSHDEAVENAFNSYRLKSQELSPKNKKEAAGSEALKTLGEFPAKSLFGAVGSLGEIRKGIENLFAPPEERAPETPRENIPELLKQAEEAGPKVYNKFLSTLSNEEFMSLPREQRIALSKQIGSEIVPQEVERTLARGILGRKGADRLAEAGGLPDVEFGSTQAQGVGEITGRLLRDLGLFSMAGMAPNLPTQAAASGALFGGAAAGEQALAGETPTLKSVAPAAVIGAATQVAPELLGRLFNFLKTKIPFKGEGIHGPTPKPPAAPTKGTIKELEFKPAAKQIEFKPGEVPPSPTPGPQSAAEAQELYNNIINDSIKNLEGRGITLEAINSGDARAIQELQKEANKVANLYKEADKLNIKEFTKQRNDILKKIPESPLEKYYAPKKEVISRPETIAKNAERIKPLETLIKQNERKVRDLQYQILSSDEAIRSGTLLPEQIARVKATREANALAHTQAMDVIKNAKFEIKYGRPPMTLEDISKQIETTFKDLREGIKNPGAQKMVTFQKGFERDKHLIDEAIKLAERGELPGPQVFDEYIKIHKEYAKAYDALAEELKGFIKEHKGKPRWGNKVQNAEKLSELIKNQKKLSEAKIKLQEDKRKAMSILDKPSGSFIKNSLRNTRKDVEAFQKDFFKWNKIAEGTEAKAAKVAGEKIKAPPKVESKTPQRKTLEPKEPPKVQKKHAKGEIGEAKKVTDASAKAAKNPTSENISAASEASGMSKEEVKDYMKKIHEKAGSLKDKIKSGEASPADELSLIKQILALYKKAPKIVKGAVNGVVIGTVQGLSEEYFGYRPNQTIVASGIAAVTKGNIGIRGGAAGIGTYVSHYIRNSFNSASADRLRELRKNPDEYNKYYRKLKSKYGDSRAAKIRKEALES